MTMFGLMALHFSGISQVNEILINGAEATSGKIYKLRKGFNVGTGISIKPHGFNPSNPQTIFAVESTGAATRFGVTQGYGAYARDGFWSGVYDTGVMVRNVGFKHSGNNLQFYSGGQNKMTLTPSGSLYLGKSLFTSDQGGSLELGGKNDTPGTGLPYIDFHYGPSGNTVSEDYDVRLINEEDGQLSLKTYNNANLEYRMYNSKANRKSLINIENGTNNKLLVGVRENDGAGFIWHESGGIVRYDMTFVADNIEFQKPINYSFLNYGQTWSPGINGTHIGNKKVSNGWAMKVYDNSASNHAFGAGSVDLQAQAPNGGKIELRANDPHVVLGRTGDPANSQTIIIGRMVINQSGEAGPDYVFEEEYKSSMPSLTEIEQFLIKEKHLYNFPAASEYEENFNIQTFSYKLLEKLEELYLYTIDQEKRLIKSEELITDLKKELNYEED